MTPLPELLNGEELQNPIEVMRHKLSDKPRYGVVCLIMKKSIVWRGSQRFSCQTIRLYTHRGNSNKCLTHI